MDAGVQTHVLMPAQQTLIESSPHLLCFQTVSHYVTPGDKRLACTFGTMMAKPHCQLDRTYCPLEKDTLGISVRMFPESSNWGRKTHPECKQSYYMMWGPELRKEEWTPAFTSLYLLTAGVMWPAAPSLCCPTVMCCTLTLWAIINPCLKLLLWHILSQ